MIVCAPWLLRLLTGNFARAIVLFPFVLLRYPEDRYDQRLLNHEKIHVRQQIELLVIPFYIWYLAEYGWHRWRGKNRVEAYLAISFEREAYGNEDDFEYLSHPHYRTPHAQN